MSVINISNGAFEYVGAHVTNRTVDLTAVTVELSLGTKTAPGTWVAAEVAHEGKSIEARVLVGDGLPVDLAPGRYVLWVRITGTPEIIVRSLPNNLVTLV